uniref:Uncharacterized protein n=1 Tax=Rhizophora mucronata TaxID=61149 RepID=A0A2P2NDW2_RHIMU
MQMSQFSLTKTTQKKGPTK